MSFSIKRGLLYVVAINPKNILSFIVTLDLRTYTWCNINASFI